MFPVLIIFLSLIAEVASFSQSHDTLISPLTARQASPSVKDCNATCGAYAAAKKACTGPNCGCTTEFLQAQGDCLVCQTTLPADAAAVSLTLDAEVNQCNVDGVPVVFKLQLPPDAQAVVDKIDLQTAELKRQQTAFLALQIIGGHVGLVIVLAFAVFSKRFRRDPTFLNFCITWIFSSVVYSLLLYRGTQGNSIINSLGRVNPTTCLVQAALINGTQVMTACATLALVVQLWLGLRAAVHGNYFGPKQKMLTTVILLGSPYIFFLAFLIPSLIVGNVHITLGQTSVERVLPTNFYCSIVELSSFLQAIYGVTLGLLIIATVFDVLIINILYRHWMAFRHVQTKSAISLSLLLRVMTFSLYRFAVAVAYGTVLNKPPQVMETGSGDTLSVAFGVPTWVDMLQAAIPLTGFLVLGINQDMITSFIFWRKNKSGISTVKSISTANTNISMVPLRKEYSSRSEKTPLTADFKLPPEHDV